VNERFMFMLLKEKIFLANCDSVRGLDLVEIKKRFLVGLVFADGVVLSTNILLDNPGFWDILNDRFVLKYLREEGLGKLSIRSRHSAGKESISEYFQTLPESYILSSFSNSPRKDQLSDRQLRECCDRLESLDILFESLKIKIEYLNHLEDTQFGKNLQTSFLSYQNCHLPGNRESLLRILRNVTSRSESYHCVDSFYGSEKKEALAFKAEFIDPVYNKLFIKTGEAFVQDNIRILGAVPEKLMRSGIAIKSLRREIELIKYPIMVFDFISAFGSGSILKFFTDEAIDYLEDTLIEKGYDKFTRKNWFGMYETMTRKMGVEIK